jgi:hypothetical protein
MRFLMGFLIVSGLILVEIGIAEILLQRDADCRESIQSTRLVVDPYSLCTSEEGMYFLHALSRGPFAAEDSEVPQLLAWIAMGISYGLIVGFLAQFPRRTAILVFSGFHILALFSFTVVAFASTFIV